MSILNEIRKALTLKDPSGWSGAWGQASWAGVAVNEASAMQLMTLWAGVRMKARTLSTLPIGFYERRGDNDRVAADGHWLADILEVSPNADQTPAEFWEGANGCLSLRGNFYARKAGLRGSVAAQQFASLETMHPDATNRRRDGDAIVFDWRDPEGKLHVLPEDEVFHLKGFSLGQALGEDPMRIGRQSIGSALAADRQTAKLFLSGLQQAGFLKVDQELQPAQRKQLQGIMDEYLGSDKAGKMMILEAGMEYKPLSLKPEEAQLLTTRRFNIEELCRLVGIPPILIGHAAEGQTMFGSGVEQIFLYWLQTELRPSLVGIELRIRKQLLPPTERRRFYAEHAVEGLLRADSAGRAALYSSLIQNAVMKPAEARSRENLGKADGADELLVQSSIVRLRDLGQNQDPGQSARNALRSWLLSDAKQGNGQ